MTFDPMHDGERLSAYLDDAVSPEQKKEIEALLDASAEARAFLEGLRQTQSLFDHWAPAEPDAFFMRRVEARIASENAFADIQTRQSARFQKFAVAAMFLLTLGGMLFVSYLKQAPQGYTDVESFLRDGLDQDVEQVVASTESDVSKDMVLELVLTNNVR